MTKAQLKRIKELLPILKAVRERCLDCSAYSSYEVQNCVIPSCPLYLYRFGTLPSEMPKNNKGKNLQLTKKEPLETGESLI